MESGGQILVVDDDPDIRKLLVTTLASEGFAVQTAQDGTEALAALTHSSFDLVLLDVMMPEISGLELLGRVREISNVTVLLLSARTEELDQLLGFALGADDYIPKPFRPRELAARVRARIRRMRSSASPQPCDECLAVGDLVVEPAAHQAKLHSVALPLTPKEFAVLEQLARHPGRPQSTRALFENIWHLPYDASAANAVMVHIRHLRKKMTAIEGAEVSIQTVWGVGYKLVSGA